MGVPYEAVLVSSEVTDLFCQLPLSALFYQLEMYKGNGKMGIRKTVTGRENILKNKGNERTGIRE
jgi:hypothetical protein